MILDGVLEGFRWISLNTDFPVIDPRQLKTQPVMLKAFQVSQIYPANKQLRSIHSHGH